jgi:hypothetical protein
MANGAVTGLSFSDVAGDNRGYRGLWIGNVAQPFGDEGSSLYRDLFLAVAKDEVLPTTVNVVQGAPSLIGSLIDADGFSVPPGVGLTLTQPDGTVLNSETPIWSDNLVLHHDSGGNLSGFIVQNPMPGTWQIATHFSDQTEPSFQLFVHTLPVGLNDVADIDQTLSRTFTQHFSREQIDTLVEKYELGSWACFWCRVGLWAIAALIAVLIATAMSYVTVGSAAVTALAAALGIAATAALAFIRTLAAVVSAGVGWIVNQICAWTGVCSKGLDPSIAPLSLSDRVTAAVGAAAGAVTILFNNASGGMIPYFITGFRGSSASGTLISSGVASGTRPTFVVSGWDSYQLALRPGPAIFRSNAFSGDRQIDLVFATSA